MIPMEEMDDDKYMPRNALFQRKNLLQDISLSALKIPASTPNVASDTVTAALTSLAFSLEMTNWLF